MIWSGGDVCEKLLGYILVIFKVTYVHFFVLFNIFFNLVYIFDSMIGDDRSLFTFFRYEHQQVK